MVKKYCIVPGGPTGQRLVLMNHKLLSFTRLHIIPFYLPSSLSSPCRRVSLLISLWNWDVARLQILPTCSATGEVSNCFANDWTSSMLAVSRMYELLFCTIKSTAENVVTVNYLISLLYVLWHILSCILYCMYSSVRAISVKTLQLQTHCVLSGEIQRRALSFYQSEERKIIYYPEWQLNPHPNVELTVRRCAATACNFFWYLHESFLAPHVISFYYFFVLSD